MKKKLFRSNITTTPGLSIAGLRDMAKNEPAEFVRKVDEGAESGLLKLKDIKRIDHLFDALIDVEVPIMVPIGNTQRSITTAAFPILTGSLAIAGINEAYQNVATIGQELVEEFEDNKKITTMVQLSDTDSAMLEVKEGEDFPEVGVGEDSVEIRSLRNGRRLRITAETIEENDVAGIVSRINKLGELASDMIEEQTLKRVTDYDASSASPVEPYVYRPQDTGKTAIYSPTANTPGTRAPNGTRIEDNAFVDETDLEAARVRLNSMLNDRGKRINIARSERKILAPDDIVGNISKVLNSEYTPGIEGEKSPYGPGGIFNIPMENIISSPKLDDLSASAWYYGAFKKQFMRKWKLRFEFVNLGANTQAYLDSRIAAQFRIAWDVEIGATDYVYVIQNLSATTAPKDE